MKIVYYDKRDGVICIHAGEWPRYMGYTKREAFRKWKADNGLRGKHIRFVDADEQPSLSELLRTPAGIKALEELEKENRR